MNETGNQCSCVIANAPSVATTSMMECPEHGMPQNLEDTEFPGQFQKVALIISAPGGSSAVIAPLYTDEDTAKARALAEAAGYKTGAKYFTIYSLADLEAIVAAMPPGAAPPSLTRHEPGCIFAPTEHPGACYVEGALPGPSGTKDGPPVLPLAHQSGCVGHSSRAPDACILDGDRLT